MLFTFAYGADAARDELKKHLGKEKFEKACQRLLTRFHPLVGEVQRHVDLLDVQHQARKRVL